MPAKPSDIADREIVSARIFDAPRDLVFRAWSESELIAQWWGPKGFANTVHSFDAKAGGQWHLTMHGPDGTDYYNESTFAEVSAPEKIVFDHTIPAGHEFRAIISFEDLGAKTKVTFTMRHQTAEQSARVRPMVVPANEQNFDRLEALLPSMAAGNEAIVLQQTFKAPRDVVWQAWTEPEQLAQWFGPDGFTLTTLAHKPGPGGLWRWVFHGPDGTDYKNRLDYLEVVKPQRLVYSHGDDGDGAQPPFLVTVLFAEHNGMTTVTLRSQFASAEERANVVKFGAVEGGRQTLARLEAYARSLSPGGSQMPKLPTQTSLSAIDPFILSRTFDAPRELVFAAFTEPARMKEWWGPKGFKVMSQTMDLRPGGSYHYGLESPTGQQMWGKLIFREIAAPARIVFITCFSDAEGGVTRHPMAAAWPLETLSTHTFEDAGGKTKVSIRWEPFNANAEEITTFNAAHAGMTGGWNGTMDQLAEYLATA